MDGVQSLTDLYNLVQSCVMRHSQQRTPPIEGVARSCRPHPGSDISVPGLSVLSGLDETFVHLPRTSEPLRLQERSPTSRRQGAAP